MLVQEQINTSAGADSNAPTGLALPSVHDAWVLARVVTLGETPAQDGRCGVLAQNAIPLIKADGEGDANTRCQRLTSFVTAHLPPDEAESVIKLVLSVDPNGPDPAVAGQAPLLPSHPALPDGARLDPSLGAGAAPWLDTYVRHAHAVAPLTPDTFHQSAGLWLASTAIARRLKVPMPHGDVYPNLFVLWIAPTTLWTKSTALDVARGLARRLFPHLMAAHDTTPEGLLADLAGHEPVNLAGLPDAQRAAWELGRNFAAQRGLALDELSRLLASAGKDYNAGLIEAFLKFYDCDPEHKRSTRGAGLLVVQNGYLSLLGASTPRAMAPHLASEALWGMGWWPRFALLTPDRAFPEWQEASDMPEPAALETGLRRLYERLPAATWPDPPPALTVTLGDGVFAAYKLYDKATRHDLLTLGSVDDRLNGTYGRLSTQLLKVATNLAALDWPDGMTAPRVELRHLARAMSIVEDWRASAHRVLVQAEQVSGSALARRIIRRVGLADDMGATRRDLHRAMQDRKAREIDDELERLVEAGEVEYLKYVSTGGRPADRYRLPRK
jgi:hypothetical protein